MVARREDLLSTLSPLPTFTATEQETDKNVIRHNDDGTITVISKEEMGGYDDVSHDVEPEGWNDNLAKQLSPQERIAIADELTEFYEIDEQVRSEHFERIRDGLRLLGLSEVPASDVPFDGAATVEHPLIAEAMTQFQARAIEEFFPPTGPVKPYIMGEATDEKVKQGERLADYMNYQLTEADDEYYWSTDQMLFYLPMSGSAFKKVYIDPITGMTTSRFVTAEDLIVPYHARSLKTASRYCHRYEMTDNDVFRAQEAGTFIEDARLQPTPQLMTDQGTSLYSDSMEDIADDRMPQQHTDDTVYTHLEYHIDYHMPWDDDSDIAPPYIVTVDVDSREVLAVRRNWKHDDLTMQKRVWFAHYKYLPGLGFYGFGLLHIIGSLAKAVSGGIRALLDSAAVANLQGGFKSKEAKIAGEVRFTPGEWIDVDMTADELEKAFFNLPVKEPSTALANLVQTLADEGRRYATTTENMVGEASNQGPVGTTLALIEQGSKVFSGVHKRMHVSARQEFKMMATLNYEFMPEEEYPYEVQGEERTILREDFDGRVDIIPVSDPNIWSSTQRIAQIQAAMELVSLNPELYPRKRLKELHRRMLEAIRIADIDRILPPDKDAALDPVSENMTMLTGGGAQAYPTQDHDAHIAVHMNFAAMQAAENPDLVSELEPIIQAHIMEHKAYKYRQEIEAQLGVDLPYFDLHDPEDNEELPEDLERLISQAVARKLRPPPPPAPTPEEQAEQEERQREEDERDMQAIAEIQRGVLKTKAEIDRDKEASEAEQKRKDEESKADIKRKDQESAAKIKREAKEARVKSAFGGPVAAPRSNTSKKRRPKAKT